MTNKTSLHEIAESGVVLTLFLTAVGYLVSFFYSVGYLAYFKVPVTFVNISTPTLIINIFLTLFIGLSLSIYIAKYVSYERKHTGKKRIIFLRVLGVAIIMLLMLYALNMLNLRTILAVLLVVVILISVRVIRAIVAERSIGTGWHRYRKTLFAPDERHPVFDAIPDRLGYYISLSLLAIGVAFLIGGIMARTQNDYPSIASDGVIETLVISKNNTEIITKDYDTASKSFQNGYTLLDINDPIKIKPFSLHKSNYSLIQYLQQ